MADLRKALDLLAAGDWHGAHAIVQDDHSAEAAWIHAHLHRVEGDQGNAEYWYRRAGREPSAQSLEAERDTIVAALGR